MELILSSVIGYIDIYNYYIFLLNYEKFLFSYGQLFVMKSTLSNIIIAALGFWCLLLAYFFHAIPFNWSESFMIKVYII